MYLLYTEHLNFASGIYYSLKYMVKLLYFIVLSSKTRPRDKHSRFLEINYDLIKCRWPALEGIGRPCYKLSIWRDFPHLTGLAKLLQCVRLSSQSECCTYISLPSQSECCTYISLPSQSECCTNVLIFHCHLNLNAVLIFHCHLNLNAVLIFHCHLNLNVAMPGHFVFIISSLIKNYIYNI